jgi:hypothetical protein
MRWLVGRNDALTERKALLSPHEITINLLIRILVLDHSIDVYSSMSCFLGACMPLPYSLPPPLSFVRDLVDLLELDLAKAKLGS